MRVDELNERFAIPDTVQFEAGAGGLPRAVITAAAAAGHVYLHGAHVTHHRAAGQQPLLFLSSRSPFAEGRAIRGGVPVIFPWFGSRAGDPGAPDHGFARTAEWTLESVEWCGDGSVAVVLGLAPDGGTRRLWPHDFRLRHRVVFGEQLEMTLTVENTSSSSFTFEEAMHSYLLVGDAAEVSVTGLGGTTYIDKTDQMRRKTLSAEPLRLDAATDRVFLDTRARCVVDDPGLSRRLSVEKTGSATTVLWNPWAERARAMADLGPEEWRHMLCVETANAADNAIALGPGERHAMTARLRVAAD